MHAIQTASSRFPVDVSKTELGDFVDMFALNFASNTFVFLLTFLIYCTRIANKWSHTIHFGEYNSVK